MPAIITLYLGDCLFSLIKKINYADNIPIFSNRISIYNTVESMFRNFFSLYPEYFFMLCSCRVSVVFAPYLRRTWFE
jgi:hypothetical protein